MRFPCDNLVNIDSQKVKLKIRLCDLEHFVIVVRCNLLRFGL